MILTIIFKFYTMGEKTAVFCIRNVKIEKDILKRMIRKEENMKIPVIYWSGSGNTEAMAKAVAEGVKENGNEANLLFVTDARVEDVESAEAVALGCPATGTEELEEGDMEPFVESIAEAVKGKKFVLFGSHDWGEGDWMKDWEERMKGYGAELVREGLIVNLEPDEEALEACKELGKAL